jgi:general secretion pathway protein I
VRCRTNKPPRAAGFSLIEVLVALAIGGLALSAIAWVAGDGLIGDRTSTDATTALTLAEGKIAAAGAAEPLRQGSSKGDFAGRFHWLVRVAPYRDPQAESTADSDQPLAALQLYRVEVAVTWSEGARQRQLRVATLRLAPVPP